MHSLKRLAIAGELLKRRLGVMVDLGSLAGETLFPSSLCIRLDVWPHNALGEKLANGRGLPQDMSQHIVRSKLPGMLKASSWRVFVVF